MRKAIGVLFMAAALILGFGASAQAAAEVTTSDSCNLSANWSVGGSVKWNNTSGPAPVIGKVKYVALSSPGQLDTSSATMAEIYNRDGDWINGFNLFVSTGYSGGKYHYRSPSATGYLDVNGAAKVVVHVAGGNGDCDLIIKPIT
jgi:hypothetical protein